MIQPDHFSYPSNWSIFCKRKKELLAYLNSLNSLIQPQNFSLPSKWSIFYRIKKERLAYLNSLQNRNNSRIQPDNLRVQAKDL